MADYKHIHKAKRAKCDNFYTRIEDIVSEIGDHKDYRENFRGKTVYLNCDSEQSAFWQFFRDEFDELGLKRLIATHYEEGKQSYKLELSGGLIKTPLKGDGDFRSEECVEILKSCDIVVTNPPFSLFREWISLVIKYNKDFVVLGNINAIAYKEILPLLRDCKMRTGYKFNGTPMRFIVPDDYDFTGAVNGYLNDGRKYVGVAGVCWFTSFDIDKSHNHLLLTKRYTGHETDYKKYDNYDAIECGRVVDIPCDYNGVIGVPITYMNQYCPEQFEIVGATGFDCKCPAIDGKCLYKRLFIRKIQ